MQNPALFSTSLTLGTTHLNILKNALPWQLSAWVLVSVSFWVMPLFPWKWLVCIKLHWETEVTTRIVEVIQAGARQQWCCPPTQQTTSYKHAVQSQATMPLTIHTASYKRASQGQATMPLTTHTASYKHAVQGQATTRVTVTIYTAS